MSVILDDSIVHRVREDLTILLSWFDLAFPDDSPDEDFLTAWIAARRIAQALHQASTPTPAKSSVSASSAL